MEFCDDCKYSGSQTLSPLTGRLEVFCYKYKQFVKPSIARNCDYFISKSSEEPTEKQIKYAEYIADKLEVDLPEDFSKKAYAEFISTWKDFL